MDEEETKDEKYGFEAMGGDKPVRKDTQPKLEFPVQEKGFSNHLLEDAEDGKQDYSSSSDQKEGDEVDNFLNASDQ